MVSTNPRTSSWDAFFLLYTPSREELKTVFSIFTTFDVASASGVSQLSKRITVAAVMISNPLEESENSCDAFSSEGVMKKL